MKPSAAISSMPIESHQAGVFAELLKAIHQASSSLIRDFEGLHILKKWEKIV